MFFAFTLTCYPSAIIVLTVLLAMRKGTSAFYPKIEVFRLLVLSVAAATAATATASAVTASVSAAAYTAVAVEKEDGDKNDPEALVVLENIT